jgi:hypothetical protein
MNFELVMACMWVLMGALIGGLGTHRIRASKKKGILLDKKKADNYEVMKGVGLSLCLLAVLFWLPMSCIVKTLHK